MPEHGCSLAWQDIPEISGCLNRVFRRKDNLPWKYNSLEVGVGGIEIYTVCTDIPEAFFDFSEHCSSVREEVQTTAPGFS